MDTKEGLIPMSSLLVKDEIHSEICKYLSVLSYYIIYRNEASLFDVNVISEDFCAEFLNALEPDWGLHNCNAVKKNMESIDLIDERQEILVQVSSRRDKAKVQDFLNGAGKYPCYTVYYFAIADEPPKWKTTDFIVPNNVHFAAPDNIFSLASISERLRSKSIDTNKRILDVCKKNISLPHPADHFKVTEYQQKLFVLAFAKVWSEVKGIEEMCNANIDGNTSECCIESINAHIKVHLNRVLLATVNLLEDLKTSFYDQSLIWMKIREIEALECEADRRLVYTENVHEVRDVMKELCKKIEGLLEFLTSKCACPDALVQKYNDYAYA